MKKVKEMKVKDSAVITQFTYSGTRIQIQAVDSEHILLTVILGFPGHSAGVGTPPTLDLLLNS